MLFSPFSPRGARRSNITSSSFHRRFQLWSLDHPRGTRLGAARSSFGERKIERTSMRGASDDLKPESIVVYVQGVYIGVADRGVVIW